MGLKADFQALADDLFTTFGDFTETVTLQTAGVYDPTTGLQANPSEQSFDAYVRSFDARQVDGQRIQIGDKRLLAKNLAPITPKAGMHVTVAGDKLEIVNVSDPGTGGILTEIQARGL